MSQMKSIQDKILTQAALEYKPVGMVCEEVLPELGVDQDTGLLAAYGTGFLRVVNSVSGGRGAYRRVDAMSYSTQQYVIEGHGLEEVCSASDYRNWLQPFKPESDKTRALAQMLYLEKEKLLADTLADTAIITQTTTLSGSDQWSDKDNSDPISVIETAQAAIRTGCGMYANAAVIPIAVFKKLKFHPQLMDALGYKYARPGGLKASEIADALDLEKVFIPDCQYESANEGQSSSLADVWGKHMFLLVSPSSAQVGQISLGYMVRRQGESPRKVYKQATFNPPNGNLILCEDNYDLLIAKATAAYSIKSAIA